MDLNKHLFYLMQLTEVQTQLQNTLKLACKDDFIKDDIEVQRSVNVLPEGLSSDDEVLPLP